MAAGPPRPSTPKPGGNKQALMDAFASAKSENAPPNEAPPGGGPAGPPDDAPGQPDPNDPAAGGAPGADLAPAVQAVSLRVEHLTNLLIQRGVIGAHDVMTPAPVPQHGGGDPAAAGGPPPGGPPPQ